MPLPRRQGSGFASAQAASEQRDFEERVLTERLRDGDEHALETLFRVYYEPLCAFIAQHVENRETARDLTQNIFMRLWVERTRLEIRGSVRGYLYAAARFEAISARRKSTYASNQISSWSPSHNPPGASMQPREPDDLSQLGELRDAIQKAIAELPPRCRTIVTLRWQHQLTNAEIAQTLGISTKTVENQMTIGFRVLRVLLAPHGPGSRSF